ncbi:MAG: phenylalanine--tRNA ligase subunit alpha, partial [Clostridia bacterium]|nr:phenylalanine--tRNA ligase subunit alpha [Clostridia bacterium]
MFEELKQIREAALRQLEEAVSSEELNELSTSVLGRGGKLTAILRTMGKLSAEERAEMGKRANLVKQELAERFEERRAALAELAEQRRIEREAIDVTLPGVRKAAGTGALNPLTLVYREIRDALVGLGFTTFEGPEVEYDEYNFTLLNLPPDHPARDMQDTFYINDKVLLRTHTSPCEARALKTLDLPFRLVIPGRCFRVDEPDASH